MSELFGPPVLFFNFKSFLDASSWSFIRFQSILHESGRVFSGPWNFYKLKRGTSFLGGTIFAECLNYLVPVLYFNFERFLDSNSSPFISFHCIFYDSGVLLSGYSNLYKLKWADWISGGNQFFRISGLFGLLFCI